MRPCATRSRACRGCWSYAASAAWLGDSINDRTPPLLTTATARPPRRLPPLPPHPRTLLPPPPPLLPPLLLLLPTTRRMWRRLITVNPTWNRRRWLYEVLPGCTTSRSFGFSFCLCWIHLFPWRLIFSLLGPPHPLPLPTEVGWLGSWLLAAAVVVLGGFLLPPDVKPDLFGGLATF